MEIFGFPLSWWGTPGRGPVICGANFGGPRDSYRCRLVRPCFRTGPTVRVVTTDPSGEMDVVENDEGGSILLVSWSGLVKGRVSQVVTSLSPDQARAAARILLPLSNPQGGHARGLRPIRDTPARDDFTGQHIARRFRMSRANAGDVPARVLARTQRILA